MLTEASFLPNKIDSSCLQCTSLDTYISRYGDFYANDNADDDTTDYFTPCTCVWGNNAPEPLPIMIVHEHEHGQNAHGVQLIGVVNKKMQCL